MKPDYPIEIYYDDRDNIYVANIPDLKYCMAHGKTPEEALKEVLIVKEMWFEDREPLPMPTQQPEKAPHKTIKADYVIKIFFSEEDEGYIADIPEMKYCSAFGDTPEEALKEVLIAKELWVRCSDDKRRL